MPIHLIWGSDTAAIERATEALISDLLDPAWISINLSRLDGKEADQASKALEEARTPPFGSGERIVLLNQSPFCNNCPSELAKRFEKDLELIPPNCHLVLANPSKPDARLKTTKYLKNLIKSGQAKERTFNLPAFWDQKGQRDLVESTAQDLGLRLEEKALSILVEAIGTDSTRLVSELEKLALHAGIENENPINEKEPLLIKANAVSALTSGITTNSLQIGNSLLNDQIGDTIGLIDALLETGEPALKIIATLTGQVRGWLWVSLLESHGEKDVSVIAQAAGISNPKRIYVMRKQLQGIQPKRFLNLLSNLLTIEAALKRGVSPKNAFRDGLLMNLN